MRWGPLSIKKNLKKIKNVNKILKIEPQKKKPRSHHRTPRNPILFIIFPIPLMADLLLRSVRKPQKKLCARPKVMTNTMGRIKKPGPAGRHCYCRISRPRNTFSLDKQHCVERPRAFLPRSQSQDTEVNSALNATTSNFTPRLSSADELARPFHEQFYRPGMEIFVSSLARMAQASDESPMEYLTRFKSARNWCRVPLPEVEFVRIVLNGLDVEYKKKFLGANIRDMYELAQHVEQYDYLLREEKISKSPSRGTLYKNPTALAQVNGKDTKARSATEEVSKSSKVYTFDITKADAIFDQLLAAKIIKLRPGHIIPKADELKGKVYCKYHNSNKHATNNCVVFRDTIQSWIEKGKLKFPEKQMAVDVNPFPSTTIGMVDAHLPKNKRKAEYVPVHHIRQRNGRTRLKLDVFSNASPTEQSGPPADEPITRSSSDETRESKVLCDHCKTPVKPGKKTSSTPPTDPTISPKELGPRRQVFDRLGPQVRPKDQASAMRRLDFDAPFYNEDYYSPNHELLSFMDGHAGYNQIFIAEADVHKTAFRCPGALGTYEWVVMLFGLKNAGATYQRAMNMIFHDLIGTIIECAFGVSAGNFLGFLVHHRGIEVDANKARAIISALPPITKKQLQSLLGQINFLRRFIEYAASLNIRLEQSTPYYPQANGQAEASNKVLIGILKKMNMCHEKINAKERRLTKAKETSCGGMGISSSCGLASMAGLSASERPLASAWATGMFSTRHLFDLVQQMNLLYQ
ncbi:hypothetical protein D8674_003789 [Pyrus ussuriensis x Pyrus communis]|uniref:Reverse transcriptase domain-containing protein n=1 Tax=Pyrus ussuriensis x Pyrus communis TaxID=2448454 RepID=A0A5N5FWW6_9ROSA|nr:hypothetical protein D8674_003789 [Pyrus ussuriensis x Pyrus communis]